MPKHTGLFCNFCRCNDFANFCHEVPLRNMKSTEHDNFQGWWHEGEKTKGLRMRGEANTV